MKDVPTAWHPALTAPPPHPTQQHYSTTYPLCLYTQPASQSCLHSPAAKSGSDNPPCCCKRGPRPYVPPSPPPPPPPATMFPIPHNTTTHHSSEHLQTRITTKYNIPNLSSPKYAKALANKKRKLDTPTEPDAPTAQTPRAYLTLKTYDPASGVVLKYKTDKAAEVGRLIGSLARLGRHMAALPEIKDGMLYAVLYILGPPPKNETLHP